MRLTGALDPARALGAGIHSLLIVRHGYLVSESYFQGNDMNRPADLHSVAKSVVSTLIGMGIDRDQISSADIPSRISHTMARSAIPIPGRSQSKFGHRP